MTSVSLLAPDSIYLPIITEDECSSVKKVNYQCPITLSLMKKPVQTPCGHIFEEANLLEWLNHNSTCPLDRRIISKETLVLQTELQNEILNFLIDLDDVKAVEEYIQFLTDYKNDSFSLLPLNSLLRSPWAKLRSYNWKFVLYRTQQVALSGLAISSLTFFIVNYFQEFTPNKPSTGALIHQIAYYGVWSNLSLFMTTLPFKYLFRNIPGFNHELHRSN